MKKLGLPLLLGAVIALVSTGCKRTCGSCSVDYSFTSSGNPVNVTANEEYCYTGDPDIFNAAYLEYTVRNAACVAAQGTWTEN